MKYFTEIYVTLVSFSVLHFFEMRDAFSDTMDNISEKKIYSWKSNQDFRLVPNNTAYTEDELWDDNGFCYLNRSILSACSVCLPQ